MYTHVGYSMFTPPSRSSREPESECLSSFRRARCQMTLLSHGSDLAIAICVPCRVAGNWKLPKKWWFNGDLVVIYGVIVGENMVYGGFQSHGGTPIAGWFISWETHVEMDETSITSSEMIVYSSLHQSVGHSWSMTRDFLIKRAKQNNNGIMKHSLIHPMK